VDLSDPLDLDLTARIKRERERGYLGFTVYASDVVCTLVEIGGDVLATPGRWWCYNGLREVKASSPV
jgi:hypothetical protein